MEKQRLAGTIAPEAVPVGGSLPSIGQQRIATAAHEQNRQRMGGMNFTAEVIRQDFVGWNVYRAIENATGFPADEEWDLPDSTSPEGKAAWDGIDTRDFDMFASARSQEHFDHLKREYTRQRKVEEQLAEYGGWGMAGRMALNLFDPVGVAASMAGGPVAWAQRGSRLAQAGKMGLIGGGTSAAIDASTLPGSMVRDGTDVLLTGMLGFMLGGSFGAAFSVRDMTAARAAVTREIRSVRAREIADYNRSRGEGLTDVDAITRRLEESEVIPWARIDTETTQVSGVLRQGLVTRDRSQPVEAPVPPELSRRVSDLESERARLAEASQDAPKRSELKALRREVKAQRKAQRREVKAQRKAQPDPARMRAEIEARMLEEDVRVHGDAAHQKGFRKARERAAKREVREAVEQQQNVRLRRAESELERLEAADRARTDVRRVERQLRKAQEDVVAARTMAQAKAATPEDVARGLTEPELADSVGAARAAPFDPLRSAEGVEHLGQPIARQAYHDLPTAFHYSGVLRGHPSEMVRDKLGPLVGDGIGAVGHDISRIGATEIANRYSRIKMRQLIRETDVQFEDWLRARGETGWSAGHHRFEKRRQLRDEFNREVGAIGQGIDGDFSPQARKLAQYIQREILEPIGDDLVRLGILPEKLPNYWPRMWNHQAVDSAAVRLRDDNAFDELFAQSISRDRLGQYLLTEHGDELGSQIIRRIAHGFNRRIREVNRGIDVEMVHGVRMSDMDYMSRLMREGGASDDEIAAFRRTVESQVKRRTADDAGRPSFAKHRLKLDLNAELRAVSRDSYDTMHLRMADFVETNAELAVSRYIRSASGRIAIAETTGIKNDAEFAQVLNAVRGHLNDPTDRERVAKYATDAFNYLVGRPLEANPDGAVSRIARALRDFNMARVGSSFGLAQLSDLGNVVAIGGIRGLLAGVRDLRTIMRTGPDGRPTNALVREMEEFGGIGLEHLSTSMYVTEFDEVFNPRASKVAFGLRAAGRAVSVGSGMAHINRWSQMVASRMMVNRIAKADLSPERLAYLGLSTDEAGAITAQLRRHAKFDSRGNVEKMNLDQWTDLRQRDQFVDAVRKAATRAVQENEFGSTFPFMHSTVGKVLTQFRSFALVSWTRQTLHMMHMRDAEAAMALMGGMFFGTMSYMAYTATQASPEQWDERLAPGRLAAAAFGRAGWASWIPMMADSAGGVLGFDPLFDVRGSGLPSDAVRGVPAIDLLDRGHRGVRSVTQMANPFVDGEFTERDLQNLRRASIFQNFWGVGYGVSALSEGLGLEE